jgi:serine/threonine-protein kinase
VAALATERGGAKGREFYRTAARLIAEAADALEHAHGVGIVHRDVKPGNLLLDAAGKVYVSDFGLARFGADAGLTMTGDLLGTLRYMAPEQALAKHNLVDHRADVYGLGATLYELQTGRPALAGADKQEILHRIAFEEPVPPRKLDKAIPAELETIALKALAKDPADRYATAGELADDLRRFLCDEPIRARRPTLRRRLGRWSRRHRPMVAAVGALALAALVLGGAGLWWLLQQRAAVDGDLREAELWQARERWPEARQALERATGRLAWGGWGSRREQVERRRRETALVARLEDARLQASATMGTEFDYAGEDQAYGQAFAEYGLNISERSPEKAAGRIRASAIRAHLIAALDEWVYAKERVQAGSGEPLRMIAQLADDDPWRQRLRDPRVRRDRAALERLANEAGVLAQPPANLVFLAGALSHAQGRDAAVALLRKAQQRYPADFWVNFELAFLLDSERGMEAEAVGYARAALALRPDSTGMYNNLGVALYHQGKLDEAVAAYRKALELHPGNAQAHNNLGTALHDQGRLPQAVAAYQKAIALKPNVAQAHNNLGTALKDQGKLAEAEAAFRKAIDLDRNYPTPRYNLGKALQEQGRLDEAIQELHKAIALNSNSAAAHGELGNALLDRGRPDEAIEEYRKAVDLDPKDAVARLNLGNVFQNKGQTEKAIQEYRTAIELNPKYANAHYNLGTVLLLASRPDDAITEFRKAIELDPRHAGAHSNLGNVLAEQGRLDEAVQEFHRAIDVNPKLASAYGSLGMVLLDQGRFADARQETQKALDRLTKADPHYPMALGQLHRCDRLLALDTKLAQVLTGQAQPADAAERLELAWLCQRGYKQLYVAAFRLFEQAFTDQPALADNLQKQSRYDAACATALAGCGRGKDAGNLSEPERTRLRRQALAWLRADLKAWNQQLDKDPDQARNRMTQAMQHWQGDGDFAGVRGPEALARLPAAERQDWQTLWEDVAALRRRADAPKAPPDPRPDR